MPNAAALEGVKITSRGDVLTTGIGVFLAGFLSKVQSEWGLEVYFESWF